MVKVLIIDTGKVEASRKSAKLFEKYIKKEVKISVRYADLKRGENGKPLNIGGVFFNISHSGHYWCMAINDSEVGIDIEEKRAVNGRISRRVLAPGEKMLEGDILRTWVLKEAYAKMLGEGILLDFCSISCERILRNFDVEDWSSDRYYCYVVSAKK